MLSSYQWVSRPAAIAPDLYNDFAARSEPGWNLVIRQPLPFYGPAARQARSDRRYSVIC